MLSWFHSTRAIRIFQKVWICTLLLLATWKVSSGLEERMDLRFYDESYYLTQGLFHSITSWNADYSPLYSLYYKAAGFFFSDPVNLYYQNYRFWTFLLGLMIFFVLRLSGCAWLFSASWAIVSISSQLALPLWPKAGHLAMVGCSLGIWGLQRWRGRPYSQTIWVGGVGFLLSWCRPEFLMAAGAAVVLLTVFFLRKIKMDAVELLAILPLFLSLIAFMIWGLPVGQSGRGLVAFGQHFVHNWRNISGQTQSDFYHDWVNWRPIFQQHFGASQNPLDAFLVNPADMLLHIWFNLRYLIYNLLVYFSETLFPKRITGVSPLYGLTVLLVLAEWLGKGKPTEHFLTFFRKQNWLSISPWLCLLLPPVLAGLLFQPRTHYILPMLPFFIFFSGQFSKGIKPELLNFPVLRIFIPLLLLWILPPADAFFKLNPGKGNESQTTNPEDGHFSAITCTTLKRKALVSALQKYPFPDKFRIFDASTGATEFLGDKLVQCGKTGFEMNYEVMKDFSGFLRAENVQGIFLHETVRFDDFFMKNKNWNDIKNQPRNQGWRKIAIGMNGDSLLLKMP